MKNTFPKSVIFKFVLVATSIVAVFLYLYLKNNITNNLQINEIAFSHENGVDWVEIYNPTMNNLSLRDLYLSDNSKNFTKFKIEEQVVVPSHGFAVIYGDGYDGALDNSTVANFRISNGETIYLVTRNGTTVLDSLTAISDGGSTEITIGRFPDGSDEIFLFSTATPGERNEKDFLNQMSR